MQLTVMGETEEKKTYTVSLTDEGKEVAAKRMAADEAVADKLLADISEGELQQLEAICDKIILNAKDMGVKGKRKAAFRHNHRRKGAAKRCGHAKKCHR